MRLFCGDAINDHGSIQCLRQRKISEDIKKEQLEGEERRGEKNEVKRKSFNYINGAVSLLPSAVSWIYWIYLD
jgi:hypothetical protein